MERALLTEVYDFSNSYVTFVTPKKENIARIPIESSCKPIDIESSEEFFLIASCKGETVYVEKGLFNVPSYDWCGIFSRDEFALLRTFATHEPGRKEEYSPGKVKDRFGEVRISLERIPDASELSQIQEIVEATLQNSRLVGRTTIRDESNDISAVLEYPIKTINVNPEKNVFQVDTGPVLFPQLDSEDDDRIKWLKPAYIAYNDFDYAEFIIQSPTPIGRNLWVKHYSEIKGVKADNLIFSIASE